MDFEHQPITATIIYRVLKRNKATNLTSNTNISCNIEWYVPQQTPQVAMHLIVIPGAKAYHKPTLYALVSQYRPINRVMWDAVAINIVFQQEG